MVISVGVLESTAGRIKRAGPDEAKHRALAIGVAVWFVVAVIAIPWPGLPWGRPLVP